MRERLAVALIALAVGLAPVAAEEFAAADYEEAISTILCDCGCHPQSVKACACGRAAQMRDEIAGQVAGGMTGVQIIEAYVAEHGDQIRIAPEAKGFNLFAWLGPLALLAVATLFMLRTLGRWRQPSAKEVAPVPKVDADDPYLARLKRQIEEDR